MKNRKEELRFGLQMDGAEDKKRIIELVVDGGCRNVVDLGAGTGMIAKQISEHGIKASAVDNNFKVDGYENNDFITYYPCDLIKFVKETEQKFDCIILSAVLHELSKKDFNFLKNNLKRIANPDGCMIIIREPYYEKLADGRIRPFKTKELQRSIPKLIRTLTPDGFEKTFNETPKLSERKVPDGVQKLNMAFTYSYGEESWYREIKENRFAFSKEELDKFCTKILGVDGVQMRYEFFDKDYKKYFHKCGYVDGILDGIEYTNCLIVAKR